MSLERIPITYPDCKLVCLIHSEAKQTKMLEFGAEKDLMQGWARRTGSLCSEYLELPEGFQQSIFKSQGKERGFRVCDQLTSWQAVGILGESIVVGQRGTI